VISSCLHGRRWESVGGAGGGPARQAVPWYGLRAAGTYFRFVRGTAGCSSRGEAAGASRRPLFTGRAAAWL